MPLKLSDNTANAVRITFSNDGNTNFGEGTPNSPLSFQGRPLLDGSVLAQTVARPPAQPRLTGSVFIPTGQRESAEISCPPCAGFGSTNGNGGIARFNADKTAFVCYLNLTSTGQSVSYSVW
jgi:hypothetical protein